MSKLIAVGGLRFGQQVQPQEGFNKVGLSPAVAFLIRRCGRHPIVPVRQMVAVDSRKFGRDRVFAALRAREE
jgi:hypothetical protein